MKRSDTRPGVRPTVELGAAVDESAKDAAAVRPRAPRSQAARRALAGVADPGTRRVLQLAIHRCGMAVDIVDNGVAAVARGRRNRPDLIIMDLQLRDSAGLQVIQWLRSNPAMGSTPVIILTTDARDLARSTSWGVDAVLLKPVSREMVESAIRSAVGPGAV